MGFEGTTASRVGGLEMTREQSLLVLKTLASAFPRNPATVEATREQYIKCFSDLKFETAQVAADVLIKQNNYFPTIAEFRASYNAATRTSCPEGANYCGTDCKVCQNKGFVIFLKHGYEFVAYCTECQRGGDWNYDGRNMSGRNKSEYFIPPIQRYLSWGDIVKNRDVNGRVNLGGEFSKNICLDEI